MAPWKYVLTAVCSAGLVNSAALRYVPGRMIEVLSSCVRINRAIRHCGGNSSRVRLVRRRVLLHLEFESTAR